MGVRSFVSGVALSAALAAVALIATPAHAVLIGGVEFPQGAVSFADAASVDYTGVLAPQTPYQGASNAVGTPDYAGANACASQAACTFVSLGDGGFLTLQFIDNVLTGSGDAADDLWIFEIGPDVEDTFVWVSTDGATWLSVGSVGGSTSGVDLDAFGFGPDFAFGWVLLQDDPNADGQSGATVGADIDAVGAISTRQVGTVPLPGTLALLGMGLVAAGARLRRRA